MSELKLEWSETQKANDECSYDHVTAETPFGGFLITWKGWKEQPSPTIDETPWGDWYGAYHTVEEAKEAAEKKYFEKLAEALNE